MDDEEADTPTHEKRCCTCKVTKPLDEFNRLTKSKDGRQPSCRDCNKAYHRDNWDRHMAQIRARKKIAVAEARAKLLEYLAAHPCVDCGEADIVVLEFDHVRGEKAHNVTYLVNGGFGWPRVRQEIEKCDVRCANCHRRRTQQEAKSYRLRGVDPGEVGRPGLEPGTTTA